VIGPGDLATSINKRGRIDDPDVQALMARAEAGILKSGVPIGGRGAHGGTGQPDDRSRLPGAGARLRLVAVPARHRGEFRGHQALRPLGQARRWKYAGFGYASRPLEPLDRSFPGDIPGRLAGREPGIDLGGSQIAAFRLTERPFFP
jgi:hypothetical protein